MTVPRRHTPVFNNISPVIIVLAVLIVGVFLLGTLSQPFLQASYQIGALVPGYITTHPSPLGPWSPWLFHVFLHADWIHLAFNTMALLAFGSAAARPFGQSIKGQGGFLLFFTVCAVAGAGAQVLSDTNSLIPMVGASTALSGCIAAAGWVSGGYRGMLRLALPWLGFNILLAFIGSQLWISIAWAGHIGGLVAGALLYPLFLAIFGVQHSPDR